MATPATAAAPSVFKIIMVINQGPTAGCNMAVPGVPAIWLNCPLSTVAKAMSSTANALNTQSTTRQMRVKRALVTSAILPRPSQAAINAPPRM